MKFGTQITGQGVRFRLWAPDQQQIRVYLHDLSEAFEMAARPRGWHEVTVPNAKPGMLYTFALPNGQHVPDPASRFLPQDVEGPSEIIDPLAFEWSDRGWVGRPWEETILYELHIGTFTEEGTFRAAIDKLDHLCALGVNTIELMPVADFNGRWNWGYDGASLFAPDATYGRPEDMKAFVDAAHSKGLSVVLDVIYNHFGPKGNHLGTYAPLTNSDVPTPWGEAVNFDGDEAGMIRDLIMANARYWLTEFHLDGLRFDAVHEIHDDGPRHILMELAEQARAATDGRHVHLVLENSLNQVNWLKRRETGAPWLYDAQWSDDIHHAIHAVLTNDPGSYYEDFIGRIDLVGRSLAEGVGWQGEFMQHQGHHKGEPSAFLPPTAFVHFMQNHDQVGNRPFGRRVSHQVSRDALRMWSAIVLLSPQIPLLFMGEEWSASTPFLFFSDVGQDLADAIRTSRREELKNYHEAEEGELPDPMSKDSFLRSKLDWSETERGEHREMLAHYRALISSRTKAIVPRLHGMQGFSGQYMILDNRGIKVTWRLGDGSRLQIRANLSAELLACPPNALGQTVWIEGEVAGDSLGPWAMDAHIIQAE
ncbi:malto-oligosyltrehalose trehalohydrolase [Devosia chinhatensis]|uniref:Malto-oligosyltrehalose trehalohydrolase n=1 Tax=Devosia chinhatensis TaxID=429727 RepID=A0A0F5FKE5_9HYPH|nr:malto-oligosyltrehalose trehalohydrolase [Devosia chinhatensis]KKB09273.1 hypothetical protein VE26_04695 [Devosia chinhatensis]